MKQKVSLVRCESYNPEKLDIGVRKAFDLLGGISLFIKKGEKVLIKPNMLSGRPPEDGVNTHTEVVRAVVRIVKECGATPLLGDNHCGPLRVEEVYETSGFLAIAKEEGAHLAEVKGVKLVNGIPIASYFFECDKIINLPKMKTHTLMTLTGAIKNMFGAVTGLNKTQCHKKFPKPEDFVHVLVDVFTAVKPQLVLMDGIIAMDGNGPAAGNLRDAGLLIASEDSVAVDAVFSYLIGMKPLEVLTTKEAYNRKLGEADLENLEILGEKIEKKLIKDYKLPGLKFYMNLPAPAIKFVASFVKFSPYINEGLCTRCKICVKTCPVDAITVSKENSFIDYHKCVKCMCCHEVCPYNSVEYKSNILARRFGL